MAVELRKAAHERLDAGEFEMKRNRRAFGAAGMLLVSVLTAAPAAAQKQGGILRMDLRNSPPSLSILEESDFVQAVMASGFMAVPGRLPILAVRREGNLPHRGFVRSSGEDRV